METMCGKERIQMRKICLGQSIQGASHKRTGKECQDFFKVDVQKDYIILAVADGHGSKSCPYSRTGAISATNVFHDVMKEYLKELKEHGNGKYGQFKKTIQKYHLIHLRI